MNSKFSNIWYRLSSCNIIFLGLLLIASSSLLTYMLISGRLEIALLLFVACIIILINIVEISKKSIRKVTFMFDAIDNSDYAFKYATNHGSSDDRLVNESLNRITQILIRARDEAKLREKYYEIILESVSTGVLIVDEKGNVYQSNSEALSLLGLGVLTHISQIGNVDEQLQNVIQSISPGEKKQVTFNNGTSIVNLSIHASAARLKDISVRVLAISDIHSELEEKELDSWIRLTRVLTHEIMNSVTPITSLSDTLLSESDTVDSKVRNGLEVISTTGRGLIDFVENYRQLTRIPTPKPSLFYVTDFLDRMRSVAEHQPEASKIRIVMDGIIGKNASDKDDDEPLLLYADESLTSRVVINLLKNALQAIGPERSDGEIHLRAWCDESESIYIEVSNNGPLITKEEQEHIFVPFYTTRDGGSGIGLALSRQIMRVSGGTLTLRSDINHNLTVFTLKFP